MEKETENEAGHNLNSFGAGFIAGVAFCALAIFFLTTKKGRELAKKLDFSDFDFEKIDQIFQNDFNNFTNRQRTDFLNGENKIEKEISEITPKNEILPVSKSILGRRFFYRRK